MTVYQQNVPTHNLTKATRAAMQRYGIDKCLWAYEEHNRHGQGAAMVGGWGRGGVKRGDAMIDAGREMVTGHRPGAKRAFTYLPMSVRFTIGNIDRTYEKVGDYSARAVDRAPGEGPFAMGQFELVTEV